MNQRLKKLLSVILLSCLAVAGNYFRFQLFFGVDLIFGSIAIVVAIIRLGMLPGLVVALVGGAVTVVLWQHPYALIIFMIEAVFVGALYRRWGDAVRVDAVFWLLVGVPLVYLFYTGVMQMSVTQVLMIALKQPLNGVFNALLATLAVFVWDAWRRPDRTFNIGNLIQLSIFTAVLFPALILVAAENRHLKPELEAAVFEELKLFASNMEITVTKYLERDVKNEMDFTENRTMLPQYVNWTVRDANHTYLLGNADHQSAASGELRDIGKQMAIWLPATDQLSAMSRWKAAKYRLIQPLTVNGEVFTLELDHDAAPVVNQLHNAQVRSMTLLLLLMLLAGPLAIFVGRFLASPVSQLTGATHQLVSSLENSNRVSIPQSRLTEVNELATNFRNMSVSLQHAFAKLSHLASHDVLLGIWNRRRILEYLEEELLRSRRYGSRFCVILFDVDNFKGVNDSLGHSGGDTVLVELTELVRDATRNTDKLARWGGEEFLLVLPQTILETALRVAEKIRGQVAASQFSSAKQQITISLGVAESSVDSSVHRLVEEADKALYRAKSAGRDRVCFWSGLLDVHEGVALADSENVREGVG